MICGHYSLGQLNLSLINEANRPKLLRYQRECAKVLARYWRQRDLIDAYLLPGFRKYEYDGDNAERMRFFGSIYITDVCPSCWGMARSSRMRCSASTSMTGAWPSPASRPALSSPRARGCPI